MTAEPKHVTAANPQSFDGYWPYESRAQQEKVLARKQAQPQPKNNKGDKR